MADDPVFENSKPYATPVPARRLEFARCHFCTYDLDGTRLTIVDGKCRVRPNLFVCFGCQRERAFLYVDDQGTVKANVPRVAVKRTSTLCPE